MTVYRLRPISGPEDDVICIDDTGERVPCPAPGEPEPVTGATFVSAFRHGLIEAVQQVEIAQRALRRRKRHELPRCYRRRNLLYRPRAAR